MDNERLIYCPVCGNVLTKVKAGDITVDVCQNGCSGIWFDRSELSRTLQDEIAGGSLIKINKQKLNIDANKERICPVCECNMVKYSMTIASPVEVDECPLCGGIWLDSDELARVKTNSSLCSTIEEELVFDNTVADKIKDFVDSLLIPGYKI